jgi:asparagine synthase (glutamine-hydrolysing)
MCGISGVVALHGELIHTERKYQAIFDQLLAHRGPDGRGTWVNGANSAFFAHYRLAIIEPSSQSSQPMQSAAQNVVVFNGEIYNYRELRQVAEQKGFVFRTGSDTETILAAYELDGLEAFAKLRGMFAVALWDEGQKKLVLVRDRFGIKPLYYCEVGNEFYFASEMKALLPFLPSIATNNEALADYLTFQYTLSNQTLFDGIHELPPGHFIVVADGQITLSRYWDVAYEINQGNSTEFYESRLRELLDDSISMHLRSDVEIGSYISGGIDSSIIYSLASEKSGQALKAFHGRFSGHDGFDESRYALDAVNAHGGDITICDITPNDFVENIRDIIYHLDTPVAGPGAFPQYMVSQLASKEVKVVLGGQGADEVFGGYARYLIAYFEQCIKAAIDGTYKSSKFVVTIESVIPNLGVLQEYKPLLQEFWRDGVFGPLDARFLKLIDRSSEMKEEVDWSQLDMQAVRNRFFTIFNNRNNVAKESYFDSMTHFEFKTLLPGLLQVEDRMSMAHGLESRVPFLDHPLVEFMATVPSDVKFKDGKLKNLLRSTFYNDVPASVINRRDKMGFPVPLNDWFAGELREFFNDNVSSIESHSRPGLNATAIRKNFATTGQFSRKTWALLSLELWHQQFHDKAAEYRALLK